MRLFTAIELPRSVREELASLRGPIAGARWTKESQLHVTLRFLGEVDDREVPRLRESLRSVAVSEFRLRVRGTGRFPPRGQPRILWAGVAPEDPPRALHEELDSALAAAGRPRDARPYGPHVTLARLSRPARSDLDDFLRRTCAFASEEFQVRSFSLFGSELTPGGAVHRLIESFSDFRGEARTR